MSKLKKVLLAVLADIVIFLLIVWAFINMITPEVSTTLKTISKVIIVAGIPTIFVISFMTFASDKYSYENMTDEDPKDNEPKTEEPSNNN